MNLYRTRHPVSDHDLSCVRVPGIDAPLDLSQSTPPQGPPYDYRVTGLVTSQLSIEYAFSLNFSGTFTSSLKGDMMFYLLELMATLPEMPAETGPFDGNVWGLGVRVGIATTKFESELAASVAGVAANASLSSATTNYAILAPGLGTDILQSAGAFFSNPVGPFDASRIQALGEGLQRISSFLVTEAKNRPPTPVYVVTETKAKDIAKVQSISAAWALNRIREGNSYDDAARKIDRNNPLQSMINDAYVRAVYQEIVNDAGSDKPSDVQRKFAEDIIAVRGSY